MALIGVKLHGFVAAALLALAAPLAILAALHVGPLDPDLHLLAALGGLTLLLQAVTFWYLPSFAKREVVFEGMAAYSGIILFPAALLGAAFKLGALRVTAPPLALLVFGVILLGSALFGKRWRSGVPFWKTESPFRIGDIAAMVTLASGALWLIAAGTLGYLVPTLLAVFWPVALLLVTLGALAHYVPRNRGRPLWVAPYLLGLAAFEAGVLLYVLARLDVLPHMQLATALLAGLPVAGLALSPPVPTKQAGARMKEAAPFLAAAVPVSALAAGLALAGRSIGLVYASYYALVCALAFAVMGLALLTLPVVFNRPPARTWLWPAFAAGLVGAPLLAAAFLTRLPRWPGAVLLAAALILWLVAMAPLRAPRRDCPPPS